MSDDDALARAAAAIAELPRDRRTLVAVDGVDGAGKTTFADRLERLLLDPFAAGAPFRRRAFDVLADAPVMSVDEHAPPGALLLLDGLFLHRDELHGRWDRSILLDVAEEVAAARLLEREGKPTRDRYVLGNRLYFEACDPRSRASLVLPW